MNQNRKSKRLNVHIWAKFKERFWTSTSSRCARLAFRKTSIFIVVLHAVSFSEAKVRALKLLFTVWLSPITTYSLIYKMPKSFVCQTITRWSTLVWVTSNRIWGLNLRKIFKLKRKNRLMVQNLCLVILGWIISDALIIWM